MDVVVILRGLAILGVISYAVYACSQEAPPSSPMQEMVLKHRPGRGVIVLKDPWAIRDVEYDDFLVNDAEQPTWIRTHCVRLSGMPVVCEKYGYAI